MKNLFGLETGRFNQELSYVYFGKGQEKLVVFPPMHDAIFPAESMSYYLYWLLAPLGHDFSVYIISRKQQMPVGYSTREMAADYQKVFETFIGPAHVMGISLGGMVAQHFAMDFPLSVKKLIIVAAAHCMGHEGLQIARRWIPWARHHLWEGIYNESVDITYTKAYRWIYQGLKPFVSRILYRQMKQDPADFIISGQAAMIHDTFDQLDKILAPTFIIAGGKDRFFPEPLFHGMVKSIPRAQLLMIPQAGHGVFEEYRKRCMAEIKRFIFNDAVEQIDFDPDNQQGMKAARS